MDPLDYVRSLKHRWKLIVACMLIALPVGWFLSPETPASAPPTTPVFKATTILFAPMQTSTSVRGTTPSFILQEVETRATLGVVPERVAEALEFEGGVDGLLARIRITTDETGLLSIIATAPTARRAELMADTLVDEVLETLDRGAHRQIRVVEQDLAQVERQIERLDGGAGDASSEGNKSGGGGGDAGRGLDSQRQGLVQELAQLRSSLRDGSAGIEVIQEAIAEPVTTSQGLQAPRSRGVRLLLAAVIGLIVGVGVALIRERLDPRIRDREQAADAFRLPVLAEIPTIPRRRRSGNVATVTPGTLASNAFQLLAAALRFGRHPAASNVAWENGQSRGRTILVTSTAQSEGKSTTVANLAAAFAEFGNRVIVLCCDVHRPTLHDTLGVAQGPGLSDLLTGAGLVTFRQVVHQTMLDRVRIIPAGTTPGASVALLSSPEMHDLLLEATAAADILLIDAAPVLATSDWTQLLPEIDGVLLVARAGATTWASAERAAGILEMLQAPVAGIALNGVAASSMRRGYGYRYQEGSRTMDARPTTASTFEPPVPPRFSPSPLPTSVGGPPASGADATLLASGNGLKEEPVVTSDLQEAAKALHEGKRVRLKHQRRSGSLGFLEVARVSSFGSAEEGPTDDEATDDEATDDGPSPRVIEEIHDPIRASMDRP